LFCNFSNFIEVTRQAEPRGFYFMRENNERSMNFPNKHVSGDP